MRVTNGKDTYEIDPKKLKDAQADGFEPLVTVSNGKESYEVKQSNLPMAAKDGFKVISGGYETVPDDQLNFLQKGERALQRFGLIKPGEEMLAPGNLNAAKQAAPYVAGGTAAAMGGAGLLAGGLPAAETSLMYPESIAVSEGVKEMAPKALGLLKKTLPYVIGSGLGYRLFNRGGHH